MKVKRKELIISIVVVLLIISVGAVYGLNKTKEKTKTTSHKKIENVAKKKEIEKESSKKNVTSAEKITDSNDENINSEEERSTSEKNSVKTESKSTKSQVTSSKTTASNSSPTIPQEKPKRWVVDTPAWNEEVRQPVYVNTWWIKFIDGTIRTYYNKSEWNNTLDNATGNISSWGNGERVPDPSGATEVVGYISHAEVGHWE